MFRVCATGLGEPRAPHSRVRQRVVKRQGDRVGRAQLEALQVAPLARDALDGLLDLHQLVRNRITIAGHTRVASAVLEIESGNYTAASLANKVRDRQGSNLRGQGPLDFKSSPVTTWVRSHS